MVLVGFFFKTITWHTRGKEYSNILFSACGISTCLLQFEETSSVYDSYEINQSVKIQLYVIKKMHSISAHFFLRLKICILTLQHALL